MKKFFALGLVATLTLAMTSGCSDNKTTLHVYNWSDYIDDSLIAKFEEENNCKIIQDCFDDNETMLAKLLAGATGYDVVFPSSYVIPAMIRSDLIQPLNLDLLPNVVTNLDNKYQALYHEQVLKYSVPYAFSMTGIAYRSDKIEAAAVTNSWDLIMHPVFEGRVSLLSDIREMLGIGLRKRGHSINTKNPKDVQEALEYILELKRHARKLDNLMYKSALANGEFYISVGYNADVLQIMQENPDCPISFFIPQEGSTCCWDEMVVTKNANVELAHKFINFLYDPKNAAINAPTVATIMPNKNMWSYVTDASWDHPLMHPTDEQLRLLEVVQDLGDDIIIYNKAWDIFTTKRME